MECKVCGKTVCAHSRLEVRDNVFVCLDCEQTSVNTEPPQYALPFYNGEVDFRSKTYFKVCRNCYYEYTHDPRAYPLDRLK